MSTKAERKRRRAAQRRAEMSFAERLRRDVPWMRLAIVTGVIGALALGVFVIARTTGGDAAQIIDPVRTQATSDARVGIRRGQLAPNFEATDLSGKRVWLSDLQGKVVLVNFYASWCTACRKELPAFQRIWEKYRDQGFEILGVNNGESKGTATDYLRGNGAEFNAVLDPDQTIVGEYKVRGMPVSVLLDRNGAVLHYNAGELAEEDAAALVAAALADSSDAALPGVTPVSRPRTQ
jgi:peroxiredoxin